VIKLVKVYIAMKRKLSIGDKMAGVTETRVSSRASCRRKICRTFRMELPSRSF